MNDFLLNFVLIAIPYPDFLSPLLLNYLFALPFIAFLFIFYGTFEQKAGNGYKFNYKHFLYLIIILFIAEIAATPFYVENINKFLSSAVDISTAPVKINRAQTEKAIETALNIFPELKNTTNTECDKIAVSNYIEDLWEKTFDKKICRNPLVRPKGIPCLKPQSLYYLTLRHERNPYHIFYEEINFVFDKIRSKANPRPKKDIFLESILTVGKELYNTHRRHYQYMNDTTKWPAFTDKENRHFESFFNTCQINRLPLWADIHAPSLYKNVYMHWPRIPLGLSFRMPGTTLIKLYLVIFSLCALLLTVRLITKSERWAAFSEKNKFLSRALLGSLVFILFAMRPSAMVIPLSLIHGVYGRENPVAAISALKQGNYDMEMRSMLKSKVIPKDRALFDCIWEHTKQSITTAVLHGDGRLSSDKNSGPYLNAPIKTRNEIIQEIKDGLSGQQPYFARSACEKVQFETQGGV